LVTEALVFSLPNYYCLAYLNNPSPELEVRK